MTRLQKIAKEMMHDKAARTLGVAVQKVVRVEEGHFGAFVSLKNGNRLNIPYEIWVLGMTEQEYIQARQA